MRFLPLTEDPLAAGETSETAKLRLVPLDFDPAQDEAGYGESKTVQEFLAKREQRRNAALRGQGITPTDVGQPQAGPQQASTFGGVVGAFGEGAARGLTTELPSMVGATAQFVGGVTGIEPVEKAGKAIKEFFNSLGDEWYGKEKENRPELERIVYEGTKMLAPSVIPGGIGTWGLRALKGVGNIVKAAKAAGTAGEYEQLMALATTAAKKASDYASIGTAGLFGGSQAQQTVDTAIAKAEQLEAQGDMEGGRQMREKAKGITPFITGTIEATGEYFGTKYLSKLFGLTEAEVVKRGTKQLVFDFLKTLGVEVGTEIGQQAGQAIAEKESGIRPEADPLREALDVIGPTAFMTLLTGGLAGGAAKLGKGLEKRKDAKAIEDFDRGLYEARRSVQEMEEGPEPDYKPPGVGERAVADYLKEPIVDRLGLGARTVGEFASGALGPVDFFEAPEETMTTLPEENIRQRIEKLTGAGQGAVGPQNLNEQLMAEEAGISPAAGAAQAFQQDQGVFLQNATASIMDAAPGNEQAQIEEIISMGSARGINPVALNQTIIDAFRQKSAILEQENEDIRPFVDRIQAEGQVLPAEQGEQMPSEAPAHVQAEGITQEPVVGSPFAPHVEEAAQEAETAPTEGQKEAGNYKKGHLKLYGFDISIENPKGSIRKGVSKAGVPWETEMKAHYGYIKRTLDETGDKLDVFIGETPETDKVYVVTQLDPETGKFDEYKVMMGYGTKQQAQMGYLANYETGWKGLGTLTEMDIPEFKEWAKKAANWKGPIKQLETPAAPEIPAAPPGEAPAAPRETTEVPLEAPAAPPGEVPAAPAGEEVKPLKGMKVKVKGIRDATGERVEIEMGAQDALDENDVKMKCLENILECLST